MVVEKGHMAIKQQLLEDMKLAMKAGDKTKLEAIRFLVAQIKSTEIDQGELNDDQVQKVIAKQIKEMKEVLADYKKAGKDDVVAAEQEKIDTLQKYMPEPLSDEELEALIEKTIADNQGEPMGKIIGLVNQQAQGRADGSVIAQKVKAKLS